MKRTSDDILDEDDLQAHLLKRHYSSFPQLHFYPKVSRIGGVYISPDIDLLFIDFTDRILTGYEFKLLSFKTAPPNYAKMREGIAEAIQYFQFGVDRLT